MVEEMEKHEKTNVILERVRKELNIAIEEAKEKDERIAKSYSSYT